MCKMARGQMVRWLAENNITAPEATKDFADLGCRFRQVLCKVFGQSRSMARYRSSRSLMYPANSFSMADKSCSTWYSSKAL